MPGEFRVRRPSWTGLFASRCEMEKCSQGFGGINGRRGPQQGPVSCDLMWKEPMVPDSRYLSQHCYPHPSHERNVAEENPSKWRGHLGGKVIPGMWLLQLCACAVTKAFEDKKSY